MRSLGRKKSNREHLIRNLATSLVLYETIDTTQAKAKEVKAFLEKVIAKSKSADLPAMRNSYSVFFDNNAAKKMIKELVPRYADRKSGFIKSYILKNRNGDNAPMMRLELVDKKVFINTEAKEEKVNKVENKTKSRT